jgi:hypothetical protein
MQESAASSPACSARRAPPGEGVGLGQGIRPAAAHPDATDSDPDILPDAPDADSVSLNSVRINGDDDLRLVLEDNPLLLL